MYFDRPGLHTQRRTGGRYVAMPGFQVLGTRVSQESSPASAGHPTVEGARATAQAAREETPEQAGHR